MVIDARIDVICGVKSDLASNGGIDLLVTVGVVDDVNHLPRGVDIEIGCVDVNDSALGQSSSGGADQIPVRPAEPIGVNHLAAVRQMRIKSGSGKLPSHIRKDSAAPCSTDDLPAVVDCRMFGVLKRNLCDHPMSVASRSHICL